MTAGRFVVGLAVGSASCVVPLYIGELSPAALRGRLVTINCVAITLGQVIAYGTSLPSYLRPKLMSVAIGATLQHVPNGWRWMVGLGALPGILQLSTLHLLPESRMSSLPPNRSC
jgi:SP family myo-inositol transporter-like MFS transporter 13